MIIEAVQSTNWIDKLKNHKKDSKLFDSKQLITVHQAAINHLKSAELVDVDLAYQQLFKGMQIVEILHQLNLDTISLITALIFNLLQKTTVSLKKIIAENDEIYPQVAKLIDGLLKMEAIKDLLTIENQPKPSLQLDKLRQMLLVMAKDIRVVVIRLANQLCDLRQASQLTADQQLLLAKEVQIIYAPLANRLGIGQIKWELEDLAFRYLNPTAYQHIASLLDEKRSAREQYLDKMVTTIQKNLQQQQILAEVFGRPKHIYSIWRKMQRKNLGYHQLYDILAVRILTDKISNCYAALGIVHSIWQHIPSEFDDYIATPKANGYQSLHTAVVGPQAKTVEIQIRTQQMHKDSELGVAAHWRYKEQVKFDKPFEDKISWIRQLLAWQEDVTDASEILEELRTNIIEDRVYVLTPKGEVLDFPEGATVLDFAYRIHTEIGHKCRGCKIGGRLVPLTYQLRNGDQAEIITSKNSHPSRDWLNPQLNYIKTSRARHKIINWLNQQEESSNKTEKLEKIAHPKTEVIPIEKLITDKHSAINQANIMIQGVDNLLTTLASCCKPIPTDEITGYISQHRGVTIHRTNCANILHNRETKPKRLIDGLTWNPNANQIRNYPVDIVIEAYDQANLLPEITSMLAIEKINIQKIYNSKFNYGQIKILLTIEIQSLSRLNQLLTQLNCVPNVINIKRINNIGR